MTRDIRRTCTSFMKNIIIITITVRSKKTIKVIVITIIAIVIIISIINVVIDFIIII